MTTIQERIKSLADEQKRAWETEGKPLADIAHTRALTAEEHEKFEKLTRAFDDFDDRITLLRQQRDIEQRAIDFAADVLGNPSAFGPAADVSAFANEIRNALRSASSPLEYAASVEEARAISRLLPAGTPAVLAAQARALSVGTATAGGNTVGKTFLSQLIEPLRQFSGIYAAGAYVLTTEKGDDVILPRLTSFGAAAAAPEATQLTGTDPAFAQITLKAYGYGDYRGISRELVDDSLVDIEGLVSRLIGENIAVLFGQKLATGAGGTEPTGIATAATVGQTGATGVGGAPSWDNLIDVQESVLAPYQANASWVMANTAVAATRKLKDNNGRYFWEPNGQTGAPAQLLGAPVFRDPFLAPLGLGSKSIFYGDFSRYWVRLVGSTRVERSDQALFGADQIAFRGKLRADGALMDASAVKSFVGGAS
ncbi:MAG: phage major capsid protein [Microbacterium sp.]|uniref:phage major capsid protein n=1 Tax=Microbacterium sp. TaxID=51671 RepID=UPI0025F9D793|nr:phage major capsid protein [Microbacterium sp.]MBQ9917787.1 phage major capsid protein [Microbacterium sp.]